MMRPRASKPSAAHAGLGRPSARGELLHLRDREVGDHRDDLAGRRVVDFDHQALARLVGAGGRGVGLSGSAVGGVGRHRLLTFVIEGSGQAAAASGAATGVPWAGASSM
jgi:hypothetical protein